MGFGAYGGGGGGLWELIGNYEASIAESSHEFAFDVPVDFELFSKVVAIYSLENAGGSVETGIRVNQNAGAIYSTNYQSQINTVVANISIVNTNQMEIVPEELSENDIHIMGELMIVMPDPSFSADFPEISWKTVNQFNGYATGQGRVATAMTTMTHLEFLTLTSNWKIGTRITVYKVAR